MYVSGYTLNRVVFWSGVFVYGLGRPSTIPKGKSPTKPKRKPVPRLRCEWGLQQVPKQFRPSLVVLEHPGMLHTGGEPDRKSRSADCHRPPDHCVHQFWAGVCQVSPREVCMTLSPIHDQPGGVWGMQADYHNFCPPSACYPLPHVVLPLHVTPSPWEKRPVGPTDPAHGWPMCRLPMHG